MLQPVKACLAALALWPLLGSAPAQLPLTTTSGAVFALLDENEWCPAGSVYVDLQTGEFMLHPRLQRPNCYDASSVAEIEKGKLGSDDLDRLRKAVAKAVASGLRRKPCSIIIHNGGPRQLVITLPGYSATTPDDLGCWSKEAGELHDELFGIFG